MKRTDFMKEISALSQEDLAKKIEELELEHSNLEFQSVSEQLSNPIRKREIRRNIARIKTIMKATA